MEKNSRLRAALEIRDAAVGIISQEGKLQSMGPGTALLLDKPPLMAMLRGMLEQLPCFDRSKYEGKELRPLTNQIGCEWGLDIWVYRKKVLNLEWDGEWNGQENPHLASYYKGEWEQIIWDWQKDVA